MAMLDAMCALEDETDISPHAGLERRSQGLEDLDVGGHGLRVREVVSREGDAGSHVGWKLLLKYGGHSGKVLDDDLEVRVRFGQALILLFVVLVLLVAETMAVAEGTLTRPLAGDVHLLETILKLLSDE
ncbi:hypothetical protein PspLS_05072 [Pyricularia sp. CBS 133598]|nr:hypothetical protein PspLS_05072 [Pyricularia sp. CBS 133598]